MSTRFRRGAIAAAAAAAALCMAAPAFALDLAEAYGLALTQDATIRNSRAAADAGREKLPQARAQLLPSVQATIGRYQNQLESTAPGFTGAPVTNFERYRARQDAVNLRQPIYRKALGAQYRQAKAQVADVNAQLERDEQTLVMRVTEAYFSVLLAQEQLVLLGSQRTAYEGQLDAAQKGFKAGAGTRTDIDDAQARLDLTIAQEVSARQDLDVQRRKLQVIINQPVTALAPVNVARLALTPPQPATPEDWTALAEAGSPEIDAARAELDYARADVDKARAGHTPTLDAVASLSRSSNQNITSINSSYYQKSIGVELNIPLFQGGYVNSAVREALANLERAEAHYDEVKRDLAVRVHQEFKGVSEGVAKIRALEQAVRSAEQLVVSSQKSFQAGSRTRIDILNAEQQASQARRDLAQARFSYLLSRVRLKALSGDLRPGNIDEINAWLQH